MIKTIEEAKKFLEEKRGFSVKDIKEFNWNITDEELDWNTTDEQLISYANDQLDEEGI